MRGRKPNWMAWRVNENAPVSVACEAMMAAAVASSTIGYSAQSGKSWKKGLFTAPGSRDSSAPCPR